MSTLFNLKLQIEFMNKGIVPLGVPGADIWQDINRVLTAMSPAEARKMRRKFRKEWRRHVKRELSHGGKKGRRDARETGLGLNTPVRSHKNSRKQKVMFEIRKKVLEDMNEPGRLPSS